MRLLILADAHVHVYPCFDVARQLAAAYWNLRSFAQKLAPGRPWSGALLLSESQGHHWFEQAYRCAKDSANSPVARWCFEPTAEVESLLATSDAGEHLIVIRGRQIVTREGLEVLALCCRADLADGLPLDQVIEWVQRNQGLPAIPWGAGKWLFSRGRLVERALQRHANLTLGDNANRLEWLPAPSQFRLAARLNVPVLPGSDPLPFAGEERRTGACGFALDVDLDPAHPATTIRKAVFDASPIAFGSFETALRFVRNQLRINLVKRLSTTHAGRS